MAKDKFANNKFNNYLCNWKFFHRNSKNKKAETTPTPMRKENNWCRNKKFSNSENCFLGANIDFPQLNKKPTSEYLK